MATFVTPFFGTHLRISRSLCARPTTRMQTSSASSGTASEPKVVLYSLPISNYAARVRYLVRRKKLGEEQVRIRSPEDLGGLKSEEYLKVNPLGKMPAAVIEAPDSKGPEYLFESSVICEYLAEAFAAEGPSFIPSTLYTRSRAKLITNVLDVYVGPHHPFLYKPGMENREEGVKKMLIGFDAIEHALDSEGPYAIGTELSIADCCLWGNWAFYDFLLPTFFGWHPTDGRPKLAAWLKHMRQESPAAKDTYTEVFNALLSWWEKGHWDSLSMTAKTERPKLEV